MSGKIGEITIKADPALPNLKTNSSLVLGNYNFS